MRELDDAGEAEKAGWRSYVCERPVGLWERVATQTVTGTVGPHRTELVRLMMQADRQVVSAYATAR